MMSGVKLLMSTMKIKDLFPPLHIGSRLAPKIKDIYN